MIHNDISFHNSVVSRERPWEVSGLFDFGDMIHAPLIQDLAVPAAEVPIGRADGLAASAAIVAGFHSVTPLETEELAVLPDMVSTRLATSLAVGAWKRFDDEREHMEGWDANSWQWLRELETEGPDRMERLYRATCGIAPPGTSAPPGSTISLPERRINRLGTGYELSYDRPLHLVRAEGVWLYDADGRVYLV